MIGVTAVNIVIAVDDRVVVVVAAVTVVATIIVLNVVAEAQKVCYVCVCARARAIQ